MKVRKLSGPGLTASSPLLVYRIYQDVEWTSCGVLVERRRSLALAENESSRRRSPRRCKMWGSCRRKRDRDTASRLGTPCMSSSKRLFLATFPLAAYDVSIKNHTASTSVFIFSLAQTSTFSKETTIPHFPLLPSPRHQPINHVVLQPQEQCGRDGQEDGARRAQQCHRNCEIWCDERHLPLPDQGQYHATCALHFTH